jgi:outer membrane protein assembly factor BamB
MSRERLSNELPEPVRRYFEEVARMQPPSDLMDAAITQVESEPRVSRFSWLPALVAVAATAVIGAVIAFNIFNLQLGPPTGTTPSSTETPEASQTLPPIQTPPPLDGLPSAGTVEGRFPVGNAGYPALAAHGSIWLTNGETGVVSRMSPDTGEITAQIDVNPNPETTRYDQNLIANESFVWATGADQTLVKIDPATNTVVERIPIQRIVYRMQILGDAIWITDLDSTNSVIRVDANTGEVTLHKNMTGWPGGLAVTDDSVWMTPYQEPRLLRLDPETGTVLEEFSVEPHGMAVVANGDALYITGNQSRSLERFSISEGRITARFEEIGAALADGQLYATTGVSTTHGALLRLDPETLLVTAALDLGGEVGGVMPGEGFLWIPQGTDIVKVRPF